MKSTLFLAAIVPGGILAFVFGLGIYLMAVLKPRLVMQSDRPVIIEGETWVSAGFRCFVALSP
jgi:C4-dicarboxylate transporter DctM subunit